MFEIERRTFFTPPVAGADLRAALVASCLRGALPPVDLLRGGERVSHGARREACNRDAPGSLLGASHLERRRRQKSLTEREKCVLVLFEQQQNVL